MYRGDLNNHVELDWQALRKPRPNLTALKDYPDIDKCKCGVQVYGYHRFWNERFHSPKADKRNAETKKRKESLSDTPQTFSMIRDYLGLWSSAKCKNTSNIQRTEVTLKEIYAAHTSIQ